MNDPFIIKALIAGILIAIISGPIGCILIWRKMAYFSDSIAHSAMLGIALGVFLNLNLNFAILFIAMLLSVILFTTKYRYPSLANDTLLSIISHTSLATGVIIIGLMPEYNFNLSTYLFGDILSVATYEIIILSFICLISTFFMCLFWDILVLSTLQQDLAKIESTYMPHINLIFTLLAALLIAFAIKIIGVLLIASLLVVPAAAARQISSHPKQMAIFATLIALISVILGMALSYLYNLPSGPSIAVISSLIFISSFSLKLRF